jgi:dihydrolipoamide dehydrogenase
MESHQHEIVVLGGGPAGYVAAIRAAQLGLDVACIDENEMLGGTCLRVGCIPSKALLESSHLYEESLKHFESHGIDVGKVSLNLKQMLSRKDDVVKKLTGGIKMLFKKNKITHYQGRGSFTSSNTLKVSGNADCEITAKHILIAAGSIPTPIPSIEEDGDLIGNSTAALSYPEVPKKLVVIGGGYIGLELGSVWNRLGSEVVVLEAMDRILPTVDHEIAKIAHRSLEKQGMRIQLETFVESAKVEKGKCVVKIKEGETITADRVLLAVGRVPATKELGLQAAGIEVDKRGFIVVDGSYATSVSGVYAVGDCIGGAMLAHKAMDEGVACVEKIATGHGELNYDAIPAVVYTHPEIAMVGQTEEQLKDAGIEYSKGVCPMGAVPRALTLGDTEGRVKILADAKTDRVLGVHAVGIRAGDLIAEAAAAMEFGASSEDIARVCHAHPTLSEGVKEAALAVDKRAIHT